MDVVMAMMVDPWWIMVTHNWLFWCGTQIHSVLRAREPGVRDPHLALLLLSEGHPVMCGRYREIIYIYILYAVFICFYMLPPYVVDTSSICC